MLAKLRSDKRKNPTMLEYRFLTYEECKSLHGRVSVLDGRNDIAEVTITSVKTWKRREEVRIGWKFGMYEYGTEHLYHANEPQYFFILLLN